MAEYDRGSGASKPEKNKSRQTERERLFRGTDRGTGSQRNSGNTGTETQEASYGGTYRKMVTEPKLGKRKPRKKVSRKMRQLKLLFGALAILVVVILAAVLIGKFMPTNEKMSGYAYFDRTKDSSMMVMLNNEVTETTGFIESDRIYLPQQFIEDNLNIRFYYDSETGKVIYTNSTTTFTFEPESLTYTDSQNQAQTLEFPAVKEQSGVLYMDLEFVRRYSNFTYMVYENPSRVVIDNNFDEQQYVYTDRKTAVRYRAGIKSPILETVSNGTRLVYRKSVDNWLEVQTPSGFVGYIKANRASDVQTEVKEKTYTDNYSSIQKNYKISLAWFQATNQTANNNIGSNLDGTKGITTVSPTWYSITSNAGDMSSLANKSIVDDLHAKGYEVWPLIDDFADGLDGQTLYGSRAARTKMINSLITDAQQYGYDGLNLDCEKVKSTGVKHYLQFVRELSVACRANNIVLSIDNYKPASYNAFYNLEEQEAYADYIIIMGYDEHYAGSESGSVASIGFVEDGIKGALEQVPNSKLINAVPFFTRIWTISGNNTSSKAVSMQTAIDNLNEQGVSAVWDEELGQYYGTYEKDGATIKIWLEEDKSIEEKMKVIEQNQLAGVAGWKLGLEKKSVWDVIAQYNQ